MTHQQGRHHFPPHAQKTSLLANFVCSVYDTQLRFSHASLDHTKIRRPETFYEKGRAGAVQTHPVGVCVYIRAVLVFLRGNSSISRQTEKQPIL